MKKLILLFLVLWFGHASGAEYYVMCQPDSFVYLREFAKRQSDCVGYLELGDRVVSDGRRKNGFIHLVDVSNESGEGWVYSGFLVSGEIQRGTTKAWVDSPGRVACRRSANGTRRRWLRNGAEVLLYASGDEWSITDEGFIQTKYLIVEH